MAERPITTEAQLLKAVDDSIMKRSLHLTGMPLSPIEAQLKEWAERTSGAYAQPNEETQATSSLPFDEPNVPFKDGDTLVKPKIGERITVKHDQIIVESDVDLVSAEVIAVFDSLGEDWGNFGEHAWSQFDYDVDQGFKGRWYVIVDVDDGSASFASYEVHSVIIRGGVIFTHEGEEQS